MKSTRLCLAPSTKTEKRTKERFTDLSHEFLDRRITVYFPQSYPKHPIFTAHQKLIFNEFARTSLVFWQLCLKHQTRFKSGKVCGRTYTV